LRSVWEPLLLGYGQNEIAASAGLSSLQIGTALDQLRDELRRKRVGNLYQQDLWITGSAAQYPRPGTDTGEWILRASGPTDIG
jgi:hypothetical protein